MPAPFLGRASLAYRDDSRPQALTNSNLEQGLVVTDLQTAVANPEVPALVPHHDEALQPVPTDQPVQGPATQPPRAGAKVDLGLVRLAQPKDFTAIMDLCRLMHAETGMYAVDEKKVATVVVNTINMDGGIIGLIGDPAPVAIIILAVGSAWYSSEQYLGEMMFFVHPDHRRSTYAKTLLMWAKHVSNELQMVLLSAVHSHKRMDAKIGLFSRQLETAGGVFVHNRHLASMVSAEEGAAA